MKNKGFTLVELLAVIVIMGIIIGISIPAVTAVQKRMVKSRMKTFYSIVEESTDAYIEQYSKDFNIEEVCFEIPYNELIKEDLLKEDDITCLSSGIDGVEGTIIARRIDNGNTFKYEYNLTCYDKKTNKKLSTGSINTTNCIGVNGGYSIEVNPRIIDVNGNEGSYTGEWTTGKVRFDIEVFNPYFYELKSIQYQEKDSYEWKDANTQITDSGANGKGYILLETNNLINTSIKIRSVDINNNISGEKGYFDVKIDREAPVCTINKDMSSENTTSGVTVTVSCLDNGSGCVETSHDYTGIKEMTTYMVQDNLNNESECSVSTRTEEYYHYKDRYCSKYKRCSEAGCETWKECTHSECGCGTYKSCTTFSCGSFRGCNDSRNGKLCDEHAGNYTWVNSVSGCRNLVSDCTSSWGTYCYGYADCPKTCRHKDCGCASNATCRTSGCGCETYKRSSSCGCETYAWPDSWSTWSHDECSSSTSRKCESETRYYFSE